MSEAVGRSLDDAIARVDDFFDGVFAPLEEWLPPLRTRVSGWIDDESFTGAQLAALVEEDVTRMLDNAERPLYGAGYCASDAVVTEGNPLAWWQGPERSLLASSTFGPGQAAIDLVRLEWYRVPAATGERHVAGPFVDYLCSNEITITSALPVEVDGRFCGVICADVIVASLEQVLLPRVAELVDATLVNLGGRVVVSTDPGYETGDRYLGADPESGIDALVAAGSAPDGVRIARSARYPFALIGSGAGAN